LKTDVSASSTSVVVETTHMVNSCDVVVGGPR